MKKYCRKAGKALLPRKAAALEDDHRPETAIKRGSIERKLKIQYTDTRM